MNTKRLIKSGMLAVLFLILAVSLAFAQAPLDTAFTYQGQLKSDDQPYTGTCDFQFGLYNVLTGGTSLGDPIVLTEIPLTEGFFTVQLDFGAYAFTGEARYLDISVRCPTGTGDYTQLQPRQQLTAAPYALYATSAEAAETAIYAASADSVPWMGISGLPAGFADDVDNDTIYSAGTGLALTGTTFSVNTTTIQARVTGACGAGYAIKTINADGSVECELDNDTQYIAGTSLYLTDNTFNVDMMAVQARVTEECGSGSAIRQILSDGTINCQEVESANSWRLTGNSGTTPGTNFIGTNDNQAFEIKVNGQRVFRFEPTYNTPNTIGGLNNWITPGVMGATICGGGGRDEQNSITDMWGTVGGGAGNQVGNNGSDVEDSMFATIAGGRLNAASGKFSAVLGGSTNTASGEFSCANCGLGNTASGDYSFVGGGNNNNASGDYATISGGNGHLASGFESFVGGGNYNQALGNYSTINGGFDNLADGLYSTIPGGAYNVATGPFSFAAGYYGYAENEGSFVWSDSQGTTYHDHGVNTFNVRTQNGAFIDTATTGNPGLKVYNTIIGSTAGEGTAILGQSNSNHGYGLAGWNLFNGVGVGAWSYGGNLIEAYAGDFMGESDLRFYVDNAGNVHYAGELMHFEPTSSPTGGTPSYVSLYGLAAAEAWYEDLGSSSLVSGKVDVSIDPLFAQTVTLTEDYQVQVTATCNEPVLLYVSEKTTTYFTVQGVRLDGKPSNCAFDYRISAKAVGYETVRLEAVDIPEPVISEREE